MANYSPLTVLPRQSSALIPGFQRTMSATTAQNGKATTCDKILDRSDYWVPQLYHIRSDGLFEIVNFQESVGPSAPRLPLCWLNSILQAVYYLNRACDYVPVDLRPGRYRPVSIKVDPTQLVFGSVEDLTKPTRYGVGSVPETPTRILNIAACLGNLFSLDSKVICVTQTRYFLDY